MYPAMPAPYHHPIATGRPPPDRPQAGSAAAAAPATAPLRLPTTIDRSPRAARARAARDWPHGHAATSRAPPPGAAAARQRSLPAPLRRVARPASAPDPAVAPIQLPDRPATA